MNNECHNCCAPGATYDCNGLKFCAWECFAEWDREEQASLDQFAEEYKSRFISDIDAVNAGFKALEKDDEE